jgi:hypothetical protein
VSPVRWNPRGLDVTTGATITASAAELEQTGWPGCDLRSALKMRNCKVDAGGWNPRSAPLFNQALFIDALPILHDALENGRTDQEALEDAKAAYADAHPGWRRFLDHGLEEYLDLHEARETALGAPLHFRTAKIESLHDRAQQSVVSAWAPMYETEDGHREVRRIRIIAPKTDITEWVGAAARAAADHNRRPAASVTILEFALADARETVLVDRATPEQARDMFTQLAADRARAIYSAETPTACSSMDTHRFESRPCHLWQVPCPVVPQERMPPPHSRYRGRYRRPRCRHRRPQVA